MEPRLIPEKAHVLSGSALKLIAVITMLIDHVGNVFARQLNRIELWTVRSRPLTLYTLMRFIGRMSFPLFVFLLVEGFVHTRDRLRYVRRLGLFALLSEIPFDLAFYTKVWDWEHQSVFITLFLGLLGLWALEQFRNQGWKLLLLLGVLYAAALFSHCDYGVKGFAYVLLMYLVRERPLSRAVLGSAFLGSEWKAGVAFIPIAFYNGQRGFIRRRWLQYAFYLFYPLHLLALYWLKTHPFH